MVSSAAAEVVAGSLRDHDRAVLIGTRSLGKGSVQSVIKLGDGGALKVTTAYPVTGDAPSECGRASRVLEFDEPGIVGRAPTNPLAAEYEG